MRVLAAQIDPVELDPEANLERARGLVRRAATSRADLLVLPEMWSTGYDLPAAHNLRKRSASILDRLAEEAAAQKVAVVGSMVLPTADGVANAAVLLDADGRVALHYAKSHLIDVYREKEIFEPGRTAPTASLAGTRLGVSICYDLRFPELFRAFIDEGAEVFVVVAEWPQQRIAHWEVLLQARAIENQAWVVGVNRVRADRTTRYGGRSQVIDPWGRIVAAAPPDEEAELLVDLDLAVLRELRTNFPVLGDPLIGVRQAVDA